MRWGARIAVGDNTRAAFEDALQPWGDASEHRGACAAVARPRALETFDKTALLESRARDLPDIAGA